MTGEKKRLFGTNGVRGLANEDMNIELATKLGLAIGTYLGTGAKVAIGTDCRTSNEMLTSATAAGLMAAGCEVTKCGVVPSPALQYYVKNFGMDFGVIITASHNPPQFNGIKCVDADGTELARVKEEKIEEIYFSKEFKYAPWQDIKGLRKDETANTSYKNAILSQVDVKAIKKAGLKVVLDCANGAGCLVSPYLFTEMGVSLSTLNCQPHGTFPGHPSEPKPENLKDLIEMTVSSGADIGIAHDGDADRTIFIDEKGGYIYGDKSLALVSYYMVKQAGGGTVVTPVSSSDCVEDMVKAAGGTVDYTAVGAPIVARRMIDIDAVFGGEENGGLLFAGHQYCRDAAMSAAKLLDIMATTGKPLSELVAQVPKYAIRKVPIPCPEEKKQPALAALSKRMEEEGRKVDTTDGVKIFFESGWALVRPSGTEAIYRIYVSTKNEADLDKLVNESKQIIEEVLAGL